MGFRDLFSKQKQEETDNTWVVYQDRLEDKKMSVRVDRSFIDKVYQHTFYIQIKYSEFETVNLPSSEFMDDIYSIEEKAMTVLANIFQDQVVFLGTATFGGSSYITFASNHNIKWDEFVETMIGDKLIAGIYFNDCMGYYKQVLYPDYLRNLRKD